MFHNYIYYFVILVIKINLMIKKKRQLFRENLLELCALNKYYYLYEYVHFLYS